VTLKFLFGFTGRMNRAAYWLATLMQAAILLVGFFVVGMVASVTRSPPEGLAEAALAAIFMLALLVAAVSQLAALIRRSHDLGFSGLFLLVLLVPIVSLWANIMLWFARGSTGPNRYGPDPLAHRDIEKHTDAISRNPGNARAFVARGSTLALVGEYARAIEDLDTAIRLNPRDPEAFNSRAFVHLRLGRREDARSDYDKAIALNPKNAEALFGRGVARLRMSDQGGQADLVAARAINPKIADTMALLGVAA